MLLACLRWLTLLTALCAVSACALQPRVPAIPPLASLPAPPPALQRLTLSGPQGSQTLLVATALQQDSLRMVLLSVEGQRLLTLTHDAGGSRMRTLAGWQPPFTADWLMSRLAWDLWPASTLNRHWHNSRWRAEQNVGKSTVMKQIWQGNTLVSRHQSVAQCRIIEDLQAGYTLYLQDAGQPPTECQTP